MVGSRRVFHLGTFAVFASWGRMGTVRLGAVRILRLEFEIGAWQGLRG
jgi:hypothetical protein